MIIKQLSLFVENRPGSLNEVCRVLKDNNININTLSLADTKEFGILRLLIGEHEKARKVLEEKGFVVKETDVLALPVSDCPGGLAELLEAFDRRNISVEYMYAFPSGKGGKAVMVFRFEDTGKAVEALELEGLKPFDDVELFK